MPAFKKSFTFRSGATVKNCVVMAPMTISSSLSDGNVSDDELKYYARRAKSGIGTVITGCAAVNPLAIGFERSIAADSDEHIPSLTKLANAIKDNGATAILQIFHAGRMSNSKLLNGKTPVSASTVAALRPNAETPRALSTQEIDDTIQHFADATRRAIEAGFDGVEIHGANTYLVQQFFSPHSNRRDDFWGGDVHDRMRFPLAVVKAITDTANKAGRPFITGYRLSPEEREEPGITMNDTLIFAEALANTKLDYIHISVNKFNGGSLRDAEDTTSRIALIQEKVGEKIAVIGVGGLQTPSQVEEALNVVPLVSLAHAIVMDPDWYKKAATNADDTIYPAIYRSKKQELDIPEPFWNMIMTIPGWFKVED
ncbi:NADH-dependent flavin oxidoreductase [Solibacillus sp. FSL H8-0538]|uniref:NADH-dependent flavin oxidoreductase n=1 Tax=Solibacillus sp. FSL H8-0538 TaxID=2921400 RepID=UPI0030F4C16B